MTNREFLTAIAGMTETHPELAEFALSQIEKMDNALAARKEKNAQKPDENAELRAQNALDLVFTHYLFSAKFLVDH